MCAVSVAITRCVSEKTTSHLVSQNSPKAGARDRRGDEATTKRVSAPQQQGGGSTGKAKLTKGRETGPGRRGANEGDTRGGDSDRRGRPRGAAIKEVSYRGTSPREPGIAGQLTRSDIAISHQETREEEGPGARERRWRSRSACNPVSAEQATASPNRLTRRGLTPDPRD